MLVIDRFRLNVTGHMFHDHIFRFTSFQPRSSFILYNSIQNVSSFEATVRKTVARTLWHRGCLSCLSVYNIDVVLWP